jgi:radical SAM PhpK family P-methyltransferase
VSEQLLTLSARRPSPPPGVAGTIDCVVVGYNEVEFDAFARSQRKSAAHSGAYNEVKTNSVLIGGQRRTYMDLLNAAVREGRGADPGLSGFKAPALGAIYLTSFLRRRGFRAEIVNYFNSERDAFKSLLAERPNAVAITTTYYVDNAPIIGLVKFVREHAPDTKIIVGGPHIYNLCVDLDTASQDFVLDQIGADIFIVESQGEDTLGHVVGELRRGSAADLERIPNVVYRSGAGSFRRTGRQAERNRLEDNSIDWLSFDRNLITPTIYMRTARSCPFSCSFCNYPTMAGEHVVSDVDAVLDELAVAAGAGVKYVVFVDDTFNVPLPRFKKLLRGMIARNLGLRWISFFRCSNADDEAFDLMRDSGCMGVFLGIESGNATILKNMNKFADPDKYRTGIRKLTERGILTWASVIVGFPGETRETITSTMTFLEESAPTYFNAQLYYHDVRSPIHEKAAQFGISGAGYSWKHASMDWREAADWTKKLFRDVRSSTPMTLYAFSIWSFPYLISQGIDLGKISEFGSIARELLVGTFDDAQRDFGDQQRRMAALFKS